MGSKLSMVAGLALSTMVACAVKINGKSYGPGVASAGPDDGGAHASSDTNGGASADTAARMAPPPTACRGASSTMPADQPPYLSSPADPWLAISDGRPAPVPLVRPDGGEVSVRGRTDDGVVCDARHDHCLRDCTWLIDPESSGDKARHHQLIPAHMYPDGRMRVTSSLSSVRLYDIDSYVAYRTIPAPRRMLKPGVEIAVRKWPQRHPENEHDAFDVWIRGVVESVDWQQGSLRLRDMKDPYQVSSARILVIEYRPGGAAKLFQGLTRGDLKLKPDELVLPQASATIATDPWSQVGKDGNPLVTTDDRRLDDVVTACGPAQDHCLRPWVWFVPDGIHITPARWDGTGWKRVYNGGPLSGPAYRTVPATVANLQVGAEVFVQPYRTSTEDGAHGRWDPVEVGAIDRAKGTFTARGASEQPISIERARVPVLIWLPGSKAEKL